MWGVGKTNIIDSECFIIKCNVPILSGTGGVDALRLIRRRRNNLVLHLLLQTNEFTFEKRVFASDRFVFEGKFLILRQETGFRLLLFVLEFRIALAPTVDFLLEIFRVLLLIGYRLLETFSFILPLKHSILVGVAAFDCFLERLVDLGLAFLVLNQLGIFVLEHRHLLLERLDLLLQISTVASSKLLDLLFNTLK